MMIFHNGTTKDNLQYKDLCKEEHHVTVAYNSNKWVFEIDDITNTMVEFELSPLVFKGEKSLLSFEYEILNSFFSKFNIIPKWINCNFTWGWFDDETGHWTGAVGQVDRDFNQE